MIRVSGYYPDRHTHCEQPVSKSGFDSTYLSLPLSASIKHQDKFRATIPELFSPDRVCDSEVLTRAMALLDTAAQEALDPTCRYLMAASMSTLVLLIFGNNDCSILGY
jgi:hypothetical protein